MLYAGEDMYFLSDGTAEVRTRVSTVNLPGGVASPRAAAEQACMTCMPCGGSSRQLRSQYRSTGRRRSSIFRHVMKLSHIDPLASLPENGAAPGYEIHRTLDAGSFFGEQACLTGDLFSIGQS